MSFNNNLKKISFHFMFSQMAVTVLCIFLLSSILAVYPTSRMLTVQQRMKNMIMNPSLCKFLCPLPYSPRVPFTFFLHLSHSHLQILYFFFFCGVIY